MQQNPPDPGHHEHVSPHILELMQYLELVVLDASPILDASFSVTYATALQGSVEKEGPMEIKYQLVVEGISPTTEATTFSNLTSFTTPIVEDLEEVITDDTILYHRKLQEVIVKDRSDSTKLSIDKLRTQIFAELRDFGVRIRSKGDETFTNPTMPQAMIHTDIQDETLTNINVEQGDFEERFITVTPKKRGRGLPRKFNK